MTMWDDLPEELLTEVLVRLPAISLWELRRTSKAWLSLIDSESFIKLHYTLGQSSSLPPGRPLKLMFHCKPKGRFEGGLEPSDECVVAEFNSPEKMKSTISKVRVPSTMLDGEKNTRPEISGSCNGLICLTYSNVPYKDGPHYSTSELRLGVVLWNPSLAQTWRLPDSPVSLDCKEETEYSGFEIKTSYGFGYDEAHDDYKVVRVVQIDSITSSFEQEIKVYSLKSNSWKSLSPDELFPLHSSKDGVLVNHSLHWLGECFDDFSDTSVIMAFDLKTDKFHLVPLPPGFEPDVDDFFNTKLDRLLGNVDGCLSFICEPKPWSNAYHLWVMKEYRAKESWTRFVVAYDCINTPQYYTMNWLPNTATNLPEFIFGYTKEGSKTEGGERKLFLTHWYEFVWCNVNNYDDEEEEKKKKKSCFSYDDSPSYCIHIDENCMEYVSIGCIYSGSLARPWLCHLDSKKEGEERE